MLPDELSPRRFRRWLRSGGRLSFKAASITLFVVLLGLLAFLTATSSSIIGVAIATFVLFYMLRSLLPADAIDQLTTDLMTGELGERQWDRLTTFFAALRRRLPF
jgi:hypothetical protein